MANTNRTKNAIRNILSGIVNKLVTIFFPFITRTIIIYSLGAEFTGLSGLFTSILEVLNLAELGFNSAIVYSLYKPFANKNEEKIVYYLSLIKKIYFVVGSTIFVCGFAILPFLDVLIRGDYPNSVNIYILYILYLVNAGISYFLFAYKECLLIADQRKDVCNNIRTIVNLGRYVGQIIILLVTRNFYLYVVIQIIGTIVSNILIQFSTKRRYPNYIALSKTKLQIPNELRLRVGGLLIDRIGDICRNSFDNLIVSSCIGLVATAIYGNYYYIYNAVYMMMIVICNALLASVGNCIVTESVDYNWRCLGRFEFIFSYIRSGATVCLFCLYQPFMKIWVGDSLMLSEFNMILFVVYFYVINMNNVRNLYIDGGGLWWRLKESYIVEAVGNLVLNIVLGRIFGITGVLIATIITIVCFNFVWRCFILFDTYFGRNKIKVYFTLHIEYILVTVIAGLVSKKICGYIPDFGFLSVVLSLLVCVVVVFGIYCIVFIKTQRFKDACAFARSIIKK